MAKKKKAPLQAQAIVAKRPPPPPLPAMTYEVKMQVAATKYFSILNFLARHGPATTVEHLRVLLKRSRPAVMTTLEQLEREGKVMRVPFDGCESEKRKKEIWGVTAAGLADPFVARGGAPFRGVTKKTAHELGVQRAFLYARAAGWTEWKLSRNLMLREANGRLLPTSKLPDAVGLPPPHQPLTALEFERTPKDWKLYVDIFKRHANCIAAGKYGKVVYLCEGEDHHKVRESFMKAADWLYANAWHSATDFRHCFEFANLDEWGNGLLVSRE